MNKIISPTGYMGSGSSAITDLISELDGYDAKYGTFEYVFLHCPNGVFDLEDKLLIGNNALRSDEAIHSFRKTMKQLYDKKYWWVGHYKTIMTEKFMDYTEEFLDQLIQYRPEYYWYYQENADKKMIVKLVINKILKILSFQKFRTKKPLVYNDLLLSYVTPEEFYSCAKKYLKKLWRELEIEQHNIILDQLVLPYNLQRLEHYFEEDEIKVFVVDRDPRDVFVMNKYIWAKNGEPVPYPTDVYAFCRCYRGLRRMEKDVKSSQICRVHFEDLVYHYEESLQQIYEFLGISSELHQKKKHKFKPEHSIENTQLFLAKEQFKNEALIIEKELKEYLYAFPYARIPNCEKSF